MASDESHVTVQKRLQYSPPWADVSIIGIAGSSGSGKSTLAHAICQKLNLPWVVILSMVSGQFAPSPCMLGDMTDADEGLVLQPPDP